MTTRVEQDKQGDANTARRDRDLKAAAKFKRVGSLVRVGVTRIGSPDGIGDGEFARSLQKMLNLSGSFSSKRWNTMMDVDHLYGHWADNRDYFLTHDRGILNKRVDLAGVGITVCTPEEFVGMYDRGERPQS